jgi:hypothetical protein
MNGRLSSIPASPAQKDFFLVDAGSAILKP